ncbi:predicted protein [Naegleria gruberi]|uniref:Predicted protein n=1 Tax=Naegleria gruberi TaxID=5762 RepID=D2VGH9_NAEGR|nr:uncharacterized protein NAEGRDRAFT_67985 [Naegleria gruberi]EFC44067.1 predicted protein [Naegleria gruberi]|eukprot:XP_002676811.1 predicted protein [Naegleria gruberi strain NEG-M]
MSQDLAPLFHSSDQEFICYFLSMLANVKDLENCKLISQEWNEIMQTYSDEIYSNRMEVMIKRDKSLKGLQIMLKAECKKFRKNTVCLFRLFIQLSEKWKVFCLSGYFPLLTGFDSYLIKFINCSSRGIRRTVDELEKLNKVWENPENRSTYYSFHSERDLEDSFRIHHRTWINILEKTKWSIGLDRDETKEITKGMSKLGGSADIPKEWCGQLSDHSLILQLNYSITWLDIPKTPLLFWYDVTDGDFDFYYKSMAFNTDTKNYLFGYGDAEYVPKEKSLFASLFGDRFGFADGDCLYVSCAKNRDSTFDFDTLVAKISY